MYLNMKVFLLSVLFFVILPSLEPADLNGHSDLPPLKQHLQDDSVVCLLQDNQCTHNQNITCVGTVIPYITTSIALDFISLSEIQDNHEKWQHLKNVPCWFAIQPLSCAVYTSKCEKGFIFLPFTKMFNVTHGSCRSVEPTLPAFLQSENETLHLPRCWNSLQEANFIASVIQFQGVGQVFCVLLQLLRTCVVLLVVFIELRLSSRHPGILIFYIVVCLWLYIQFFPAKTEIVCSPHKPIEDKYARSEFSIFLFLHYIRIVIIVLFVIIIYALHVLFEESGIILKDMLNKKTVSFKVPAWNITVVLITAVVATTEIDVDSIRAFFSENRGLWTNLLCFAYTAITCFGMFVLYMVVKINSKIIQVQSEQNVNLHIKKKIPHVFLKIGLFSAIPTAFLIIFWAYLCHSEHMIQDSRRIYLVNSASSYSSIGEHLKCLLKNHLNIAVAFFGIPFGLVIISLLWTKYYIENFFFRALGVFSTDKENKSISEEKYVERTRVSVFGEHFQPMKKLNKFLEERMLEVQELQMDDSIFLTYLKFLKKHHENVKKQLKAVFKKEFQR